MARPSRYVPALLLAGAIGWLAVTPPRAADTPAPVAGVRPGNAAADAAIARSVRQERIARDGEVRDLRNMFEEIEDRRGLAQRDPEAVAVALLALARETPDWDRRFRLANDIGKLRVPSMAPALIAWATQDEDVRLAWLATFWLGAIPDADVERTLATLAASHWYAPVREQAARTRRDVRRAMELPDDGEPAAQGRRPVFSVGIDFGLDCGTRPVTAPEERITSGPHAGTRRPVVLAIPSGGRLVGTDIGEFGGDVHFEGRDGRTQRVLGKNTHALRQLGEHIVAVTGLAHLSSNDGVVYRLHTDAEGRWQATPWRALPGAPLRVDLADDGALRIDTRDGGRVAIAPDGTMRQEPCASDNPATASADAA